jgi:putative addiction module killer protein
MRINRLRLGSFGDYKAVGDGVCELRIDYGPGYRVYFGRHGTEIVILLIGGDKRSQDRDIETAKEYWADYQGARIGGERWHELEITKSRSVKTWPIP